MLTNGNGTRSFRIRWAADLIFLMEACRPVARMAIVIPYKKMSPYLIKALVATEDERFYEHSGIDFRALGRAIVKRGILGPVSYTHLGRVG